MIDMGLCPNYSYSDEGQTFETPAPLKHYSNDC